MSYTVRVYSHTIATGYSGSATVTTYRRAVKVAREMASVDFMEKTIITNNLTGKQWQTIWPRFSGESGICFTAS